ncbi:hypothetical protein [Labedaea rhizosphaerae]|uniref:Uncharacterized protein n=1 Tax=Labedaea rhizosphaerae TaxID=598644 RepID=A0A4R6SHK4_LABRH|nr:hypothetical protein [Labedaea rhizosphaerae]TDQ00846.1 hypothetical protein EV186_102712 [Labedaea rhizosphaerae]
MRALAVAVLVGLSTVVPASAAAAAPAPLTNLAHLNFLGDRTTPPAQPGHTTYRLAEDPSIGVLWTYADRRDDGHYDRIGGGAYDAATNTYSQGAYNADDIARASVVYLRHWRLTGDQGSRDHAYELLRGLTYLQTASGPDAGNVVLWMQPDGTLHPSALPPEQPDPSDSGASYWLARSIWALGEGYADFRDTDPAFAGFLKGRMELAIGALNREVLDRYGQWQLVDGVHVPAWLIVDGADASAEAVLGLSAYVRAGGGSSARSALTKLAEGIAHMPGSSSAGEWPYGAILPWAVSRSDWHAWAAQMPSALARASVVLHRPDLLRPAVTDAAVFTPYLLTTGGPDNGWLPVPIDRTQIAYGADARVESLVATAAATGSRGLHDLAGIAAGWFFGANTAGAPVYDPATGRTFDGVSGDGVVNRNSGAESTIHGLLTMLALDADPSLAATARASAAIRHRESATVVEGESATGGTVVTPASAWTGESQWSGGKYVTVASTATWSIPSADQPRLVSPVVNQVPGGGRTTWSADGHGLGVVNGDGGPQGVSPAPGALLPVTLSKTLAPGAHTLTATATSGESDVDALLLRPEVSQVVYDHTAVLQSAATGPRTRAVTVPAGARVSVTSYDGRGRTVRHTTAPGPTVEVPVAPGGFTVLSW